MFTIVTCVAEFVGGGIQPWFRVNAIRLFANEDFFGTVTIIAEVFFAIATFYYIINVIASIRNEGWSKFMQNTWNIIDFFTVIL